MSIRFVQCADAPTLLKIYNQYIDTPTTFECTLPTCQQFETRIFSICAEYPYLVWEENGLVLGYAYAHRQMEREAYQWNAELSVYLDRGAVSGGIGKKLYTALIALVRLQGVKTVYGGVTLPNEKSERLHLGLGFTRLGIYHNTGYKCGAWHDVCWFERAIAPYDSQPSPILPIGQLPMEAVNAILTV